MGSWVTSDYKDTPAAAIPGLASNELAEVEAKIETLLSKPLETHDLVVAVKSALPSLADKLDGDQVDAICRSLVAKGILKQV